MRVLLYTYNFVIEQGVTAYNSPNVRTPGIAKFRILLYSIGMVTRTLTKDTVSKIGEEVTLFGWVDSRRDHGKLIFIDLRDRWGMVQAVFTPGDKELLKRADELRPEWVIRLSGKVKERPKGMQNSELPTGTIELEATDFEVLNRAKTPPFPLDTDGYDINEETRLEYRYLDLRRARLQKNLMLRDKFVTLAREFLHAKDFLEIETPVLTKSTPEGSRDFVVPSRLQPGKFYALPQSPQQYKQLLMIAGFERYFQIARCLRDEDLRADRGFEHTQIDIEMSFINREDMMKLDEEMVTWVVEKLGYHVAKKPFPVFTCAEAMTKFGADKFDMRTEEEKKQGMLAFAWVIDFPFFEKNEGGGWTFTHNPFSAPKTEHREWLLNKEKIGEILTTQYDVVCNGFEVGGGSIRTHESAVLESVFEIMGYEKEKIRQEFGHMLGALEFGAPPHGGIAHGIERLLMTITGEQYLREVVAFPMTSGGKTAVMDAPSELDERQLRELHLKIQKPSS